MSHLIKRVYYKPEELQSIEAAAARLDLRAQYEAIRPAGRGTHADGVDLLQILVQRALTSAPEGYEGNYPVDIALLTSFVAQQTKERGDPPYDPNKARRDEEARRRDSRHGDREARRGGW